MKILAHAKINIGLDVTGIRADGYHELDTIMQEIDIADELEFENIDSGIELSIEFPATDNNPATDLPADESNLIVKAIRMLNADGIKVKLKKNIPMQAGLGGGSSDAAATLKAVNELKGLGLSIAELEAFAVKLGADVPFFIRGGAARCRGIGEVITSIEPLKYKVVIKKPEANAGTGGIYKKYDALDQTTIRHPDIDRLLEGDLTQVINVLENVTGAEIPEIKKIEDEMLRDGAVAACMTGSGSAVFGLYKLEG